MNSVLSEVLKRPFRGVRCEAEEASLDLLMQKSFCDIKRGGIIVRDVKGSASTWVISVRGAMGCLGTISCTMAEMYETVGETACSGMSLAAGLSDSKSSSWESASGVGGVGEVWVWKHVLATFKLVDDAEAAVTGIVPMASAGEVISCATSKEVRCP